MRKLTAIMAILLVFLLSACSAASYDGGAYTTDTATTTANLTGGSAPSVAKDDAFSGAGDYSDLNTLPQMEMESGFAADGGNATATTAPDISITDPNRKLIRTAGVDVETTEFDNSVAALEALCLSYGGYVESSSVYGKSIQAYGQQYRSANYAFRIPSLRYNDFLNSMGNIGNVLNKTQNSQDVTDTYYDIESRLKILEMRRDRLVDLLEKETNSKAIVDFENSLSETLYEIERMTGSLKKYDSLVEYSAISVSLREVEKYTEVPAYTPAPLSFGDRIAKSLSDSAGAIGEFFVELTIFVIGNILYLLIWAVIITAAVIILRRFLKRRSAKKNQQDNGTDKQ